MLCGRVVRPPSAGAELRELADIPLGDDVVLVRDGSFLGVVAGTDRAARAGGPPGGARRALAAF